MCRVLRTFEDMCNCFIFPVLQSIKYAATQNCGKKKKNMERISYLTDGFQIKFSFLFLPIISTFT